MASDHTIRVRKLNQAGLDFYSRLVDGLLAKGIQPFVMLYHMFFIAILPSFPLFAFFYGLFGGWDDATLEETHRAIRLSSFLRPLAWLFWKASWLGARISPLHGRFPISIRAEAVCEAHSLTDERVNL